MKRTLLNECWEFLLGNDLSTFPLDGFKKCSAAEGPAERLLEYNHWERIDLPHDWAIALPKSPEADHWLGGRNKTHFHNGMTERHSDAERVDNIGYYRKNLPWDPAWEGKRIFLEFEGVFRDAEFWVNGVYMDRHLSGYTGFLFEITDQLLPDETNSIAVRVNADQPEGWWYEGAGIYRNVWLLVGEPAYLKPYETVVTATLDGAVHASAILVNDTAEPVSKTAVWEVCAPDGAIVASAESTVTAPPYGEGATEADLQVADPLLWHVDRPHLYTLTLRVGDEATSERFGFRSFRFDPDEGFFLNGAPLKLYGACVHQDFGGVGVALSDNLNRYKIAKLKEMGINAYRTSHHAPSPSLLRACDELGMLVMDETRTFGTSPEALRQLESLVKRDRNHASVFLWSIGNEEFSIQNTDWGRRMAVKATRIVNALDPTRTVTYGGNNGLHYEGINGGVPVRGVNYLRCGKIDQYHREHPEQPIIGTEESSYVLSRGDVVNDPASGRIDSTGAVTMGWGSTPKGWLKHVESRPWYAGGFLWTGFDYRGEPSPFPEIAFSSYFGTIDLCGMEKPPFYYYKAWLGKEPVLRLLPHWNGTEGETVTVSTFTNCESVTLTLNGRVIGTKTVERYDAPVWELPFEAGTLVAEGVKGGRIYRDELRTAGKTAEIRITPVLPAETAGDVAVYELSGFDRDGVPCLAASDAVTLSAVGGRIVGVGNGDPLDEGYEQKPRVEEARYLRIFGSEDGLYPVPQRMPNTEKQNAWSASARDILYREEASDCDPMFEDDYRVIIKSEKIVQEPQEYVYSTRFSGAEGFRYVEFERLHGAVTVELDGTVLGDNLKGLSRENRPYRFYADFTEGTHTLTVRTLLSDGTRGAMSGYVKLGREKVEPWTVRLHYGKARVFVRPDEAGAPVTLRASLSETL